MTIALVVAGRGDGGLERHVISLANALAARHDVTLVGHPSFTGPRAAPLDLTRSRFDPVILWQLARTLRALRPDIIHAHANKAAAMISAIRSFLPGRRVATIHGLKRDTRMYRSFDAVIAVSQGIAERVVHPNLHVIYNGIAPLPPGPPLDLDAPGPVTVAVGRLAPVKGFDVLLRAWSGLPGTLLIVGDGPERRTLEALAPPNVRLLGQRDDVAAILRRADVVVIPSRREGFPLILAEALHCRRVVVATEVPGVREILPASRLVPVENPLALRAKLRATIENLPAAAAECAAAWEFAAAELTLAQMVAKTEAVYRRVNTNQS